jgi:hypothetical protein
MLSMLGNGMLGYLQQIWGLSIYFETIGDVMLSMLSYSKFEP